MSDFWILAQSGAAEPGHPAKITSDEPGKLTVQTGGEQTQTGIQSATKQPAPNATGPEDAVTEKPKSPSMFNLLFIGVMFLLLYLVVFRGPRKKQQQQRQMIQSLKKNDKVRTIGGIVGTIVEIRDDEITLKVDESNNTKIKIIPGAISRNISASAAQ